VAYVLALAAAVSFAFGNVLQQKGTLETSAGEGDPRFLAQILRRPVWLAGGACQVGGWILQAVALDRGSLIVVQSLTTLSLVFALPLGRRFTAQVIDRRTWLGALAVVVGVVVFLLAGQPTGGVSSPPASAWWTAGIFTLVAIGVVVASSRGCHGAMRAAMLGSAAGLCFAMQASVTKVFVQIVGSGISAMLHSWSVYVLIASALIGFGLQQSALKTGVLAPAIASSNAVTLFFSVIFGVTVFSESLSGGGAATIVAVIGLLLALGGVASLASSSSAPAAATAQPATN
jgi:drug/metabolite transporter (DMT)-like permease